MKLGGDIIKHLNGNLLGVVDVETTGDNPDKHEIIDVCVLILDKNLKPSKGVLPFNISMRPENMETIDYEALRATGNDIYGARENVCKSKERIHDAVLKGMSQYAGSELLVQWFERLGLGMYKRIMPIAHNWTFDKSFLVKWLGPQTMDYIFDPRFRDTMSTSLFMNDVADFLDQPYPFQKNNLQYLCSTLNIERERAHTALDDCVATAEVFRRMVQRFNGEVPKNTVVEEIENKEGKDPSC